MWLGHSIEHLVCIGGELEHHKALPSPAREKQSTGVLCSRARVYIGTSLVPVGGMNRDYWAEPAWTIALFSTSEVMYQ